ncbi:MAG: phosphoesterase [Thermoleophilia bacterium]
MAASLDAVYRNLARRRRLAPVATDPLAGREWIVCDLHTHTSWSHDCAVPVRQLLAQAEARGLGAIAITDHNRLGGALEAVELARGRKLIVIPGEEVKTDSQGEVIGLFLKEEIPPGLSFAETVAAIRAQGGLVYLPHPFDRRHAIPDPATLHRHLADIDVIEVYNARLLLEGYNEEALRFARKYNLLMGAGSDAHVLPGLGTGAVRMRSFRTPEEFLLSLRTAEILRRPRSLAYLQSLKWVAQVREHVKEKVR